MSGEQQDLDIMNRDKEAMRQEMELQLHEQFAANIHLSVGNMLSLMAMMIAVVGAYGAVLLQTGDELSWTVSDWNGRFTLTVFLVVAVFSLTVLALMAMICANQGVAQRCSQFIVYAIRDKYDMKEGDGILPKQYTPFGKKRLDILPGLFKDVTCVLIVVWIFGIIATIARLIAAVCVTYGDNQYRIGLCAIAFLVVAVIAAVCCRRYYLNKVANKYFEYEEYYK